MSVAAIVFIAAFICTIASAIGKCPIWVPLILISVGLLLGVFPR